MTITVSIPNGRPKREIIELAFDDCGLAGYEFGRTPEEQTAALRKLNAMMQEHPWNLLGYRQPTYSVGLPEDPSGVPDDTINTIAQYLAQRIAPSLGVSLSPEQKATMARSLALLQAQYATVPDTEVPIGFPRGKWRYWGW